ncbi:hypothetical protein AW168_38105 [Nocardia brasiliensis]|uniref:AbiEi antitoxin C-terminal domain-containing protein n=2 Tax=Nocardia brasiliensis TaxID=37326 RepID=K0EII9_NOCB7|nr:hypothetical protein O3I_006000 [Nocardia brasiliensis ATCC 700358]OCF85054.1 hypothetical protein AW168_38105 [Nocardia brasiliensis]
MVGGGRSDEHVAMGEIQRRQNALVDGYTDHDIRRRYRGSRWHRLRRGCYVEAAEFDGLDSIDRHRLLIDSTLPALAHDAIVSHQSAAVLYGLPLWATPLDLVHVTRDRCNGGRVRHAMKVHCAPISDGVVEIDGYWVTTPARTVVDLARTLPCEQAVVVGDAAMRTLGITPTELATELALAARRRGITQAHRTIGLLDGHSESVGESRSRVMFHRNGLSIPAQQGQLFTATGKLLGRVDFYDAAAGVVGEFDGRVKYGRLLKPGQEPADALFEEKLREDAIRETGMLMVRWTWQDLDGTAAALRWQRAVERARRMPPPRVTLTPAALPEGLRPEVHPVPMRP